MSEAEAAAAAGAADDTSNADEGAGEGTTPEEVAAVMRNAGVNLPAEPKAEEEEGEDPNTPAGEEEPTEEPAAEEEPAEEPEEEEQPAQPETPQVEGAADDKYAFEVTDANGVTFKITADAKLDDVLSEFEPKNNGQIIDILDQLRDLKTQKASDEAEEAKQTAVSEQAQRASEIRKGWADEEKDLVAQKRIPEGEDGEKRIAEVYKFMAEENQKRMEASKPTLNSFEDGLDKLENKEARDKAVADAKAEKDDARKKGSLVGGSSAAATTATPVYKANSARNANEAIRSMGLL